MTKSIDEQGEIRTSDVAWTKLLDGDADLTPSPTIVKIESEADCQPLDGGEEGQELTETAGRQRRESILQTFNRQLQRSLKAVSESPGQLKR
jgi:hypothetical protein